jgi:hypothetical protein
MVDDLYGSLKAICLFPVFLFIPGYVVAWWLDIFEFRRRTAAFRITLSVPLSVSLCPILTYLLARFAGMTAVWVFYAAAAAAFLVLVGLRWTGGRKGESTRRLAPAGSAIFAVIVCVWLAVSILSLIDLQIGDRLYYPTSTLDYAVRTSFTHSIGTTGIPPQNPLFLPGHPVNLRYHYFWLMLCSLVGRIGPVSARHALIGGTFWCGIGLMALVAVYLRLFTVNQAVPLRRRALIGILLLGITGLDIVPGLFFLSLYFRGGMNFVLPSLECWNEYVDWFLHSTIWAPHAVAALIAGCMGFLLVWHAPTARSRTGFLGYALGGGLAFASLVGNSIWVAFVFAAFLSVWTIVAACRRWWRETLSLVVAGLSCVVLVAPYLHELQAPGSGNGAAGPLVQLTVRAFSLTALVPAWHGMTHWSRLILVNGPLIPINYLLEFGFFFLVGGIKWRQDRASGKRLSRPDLACWVMLATSVLICTFLRSSVIGNNDLGWRGFLLAQFVLLLWSVDIIGGWAGLGLVSAFQKRLLIVFLVLGVAGTVYELALVRFYPVLADRGVIPPLDWMSSADRQGGKRTYAARAAYEWLQTATPPTAVVQASPHVVFEDTLGMSYSDRRTAAADMACDAGFGGDPRLCPPIVSRLEEIFPPPGRSAASGILDVCEALPLDVVVAKDTDPMWRDRRSWVWTENPAYGNDYVRLFRCPGRNPAPKAGPLAQTLPSPVRR